MTEINNRNVVVKMYRVVLYTYRYFDGAPYLTTTPLSSFGDKKDAESLLRRLRVNYPDANTGLQASFIGGCRLAAGAKEALKNGNIYKVSQMSYNDEFRYEDDEY